MKSKQDSFLSERQKAFFQPFAEWMALPVCFKNVQQFTWAAPAPAAAPTGLSVAARNWARRKHAQKREGREKSLQEEGFHHLNELVPFSTWSIYTERKRKFRGGEKTFPAFLSSFSSGCQDAKNRHGRRERINCPLKAIFWGKYVHSSIFLGSCITRLDFQLT